MLVVESGINGYHLEMHQKTIEKLKNNLIQDIFSIYKIAYQ
ncbi:hypothetical protein DCCM_0450 [Desulfocucumis palustris]|uniref:Uncharacterized protein n=1 Tax=Desulfocucumis palustris TaxID=1898651 RepID=A0A2L2X7T1_9FIRM|nr:hypothetical protein [Desulfocucumis palustris]GBF32257.1 hypothetical protein DCCM_0450 [Desulfocucumis palustris]